MSPISGVPSDHNKPLFQELGEHLPLCSLVVYIPLYTNEESIGVLHIVGCAPIGQTEESEGQPNAHPLLLPQHRMALQAFANLLASAIKNAQRYEESQRYCRRLNAFDAIVTAISSATDLQDLMQGVLEVVLDLLPVTSAAIFLFDPSQDRLKLGTHWELPAAMVEDAASLPVAGAWCEEVIHYGQATIRPLMDERGETPLLAAGLESCAYLPLLVGGTVVGILALYGGARLHKELDIPRLMPLCNQVGFAIANVRLYEDSQLERRKLNTVINSIAEGVVLCDSQGRLILANEAAMELLSLESIPFQQPLSEMVDFYGIRDLEGTPLPVEQLPMARALSGEIFHDYRVLLRGASGNNSVMSFSGAPTLGDTSERIEGAVVVFRDITANQRLERAKDEFLAVAAHELRSPLASVRGYAELLIKREQQRNEADPRDIRGLTILSQQVTHMLRMVDNLLDVSRLDAGQLGLQIQQVNIVSLITQVIDLNTPAAGGREFLFDLQYESLLVPCDSLRIRQVLTNLIGNAIKYSLPDSQIVVRLRVHQGETLKIPSPLPDDMSADNPSREVVISVSNGGYPIPPEQQQQLFNRYYRAGGRRAEGLGLGLYLSRQFVVMHGGAIWVESKEGMGNTFTFTLPLA